MTKNTLIVIAGPTAVGKTAFAIALAKKLNTVILSADSRQFYKEISIGTAKPSVQELNEVQHYFINSHSIHDEYNVGKYETEAITLITQLFQNHNELILVGGSGLYVDAVTKGFDKLPDADKDVREKITTLLNNEGIEALQNLLKKLDFDYYKKVDLNNPQRLSRAIEVCLTTGKTYSSFRQGNKKERSFNIIKIGLNIEREKLYQQINNRVDTMIEQGLLDEVKQLLPYQHLNSLQTVGYKELFDYLNNKTDLNIATDIIKQNTRNFAKRQLTWFRKDTSIHWFEPNDFENIFDFLQTKLD